MSSEQRPWLGLASFTAAQGARFFGRDAELAELARRVQRKRLTVLFGQSGLGKTSLLQAGLPPRLQGLFLPVLVRMAYDADAPSPAEQIKQAIQAATAHAGRWTQPGVAQAGETLWEFLHHRDDQLLDEAGRQLRPLLLFDQFEELFTLAQGDAAGRAQADRFIVELADLVENRVPTSLEARLEQDEAAADAFDFARDDYRVLISLREDYLAQLETLKARMPAVTQNRLRLEPLRGPQALQAVRGPAPELIDADTAAAVVRFVAGAAPDAALDDLANLAVEPSLLSLILRELNEQRIARGDAQLTTGLLAGSHGGILQDFYERSLADQPAGVRAFVEDQLLTDAGFRENLAEERVRQAFAQAGAAPDALDTLVNRRLLRIEERLDLRRVELTHDVLCAVVRSSRDLRREREALETSERALAAQQERARTQHRQLRRARQVALGCALLSLLAVGAGAYAWHSSQRASSAERQAELARSQAEDLVGFLLDDFYDELQPLGRLDIVLKLSQRAVDHYASLPAALQSSHRTLAQLRHAATLIEQNRNAEAAPMLAEARARLERQYAAGERSEALLIGLGQAAIAQARLDRSTLNETGLAETRRIADLLREQADRPGASPRLRRALAELLGRLGFTQQHVLNENGNAVPTLQAAQHYALSTGEADDPGTPSYARAAGHLLDALAALGRLDEARKVAADGLRRADDWLAHRPGHATMLMSRSNLRNGLGELALRSGDGGEALRQIRLARQDLAELARRDPSSVTIANNFAVLLFPAAQAHQLRGDPGARVGTLRELIAELGRIEKISALSLGNQRAAQVVLAQQLAELGDPNGTDALLRELRASVATLNAEADDPLIQLMAAAEESSTQAFVELQRGGLKAAQAVAAAWLPRLEAARTERPSAAAEVGGRISLLYGIEAEVALREGRWADADSALQLSLQNASGIPDYFMPLFFHQSHSEIQIALALAQARQGRHDAARATLAPALALNRERLRQAVDAAAWRFELARALFVQSLLEAPAERAALRREAAALMQGLPAGMRRLKTVQRWQAWMEGGR